MGFKSRISKPENVNFANHNALKKILTSSVFHKNIRSEKLG